ncbi:MAG: RHS repeat protein [Lachnospiraceae bacterium]|nr:RHS repeat protein [Lachnospiraceae bacterium]
MATAYVVLSLACGLTGCSGNGEKKAPELQSFISVAASSDMSVETETVKSDYDNPEKQISEQDSHSDTKEQPKTITVIKERTSLNWDGSITGWIKNEYDAQGNRTKHVEYNADGSIFVWWEYEYDSQGTLTKKFNVIRRTEAFQLGMNMSMIVMEIR